MGPTVEALLSKNAAKHAKRVRNDWEDADPAEMESLMMENDIASMHPSIHNDQGMDKSPHQQLKQNSLFSSIHGGNVSISGGNSI